MVMVMRVSTTAVERMGLTRMVVPMMRLHPMSVLRLVVIGIVMMHRRHGGPDGGGTMKAVQRRDEGASLHP
jgi:hypothetical protein